MGGQFTKVMKVMGRQTTSTTMTGGPAWAQTGWSLQISTHPRSQQDIFKHDLRNVARSPAGGYNLTKPGASGADLCTHKL